jgi:hypothetical protein
MAELELVGIHEISVAEDVSPSAVANWRKRFPDFPAPVAELKSGPVFQKSQVTAWRAKRLGKELEASSLYYDQLATKRGDDAELMAKVEETVKRLVDETTSVRSPGMLLGKIQSGKTRAFLGIIARCFDRGYDVAVILTKGTKPLSRQTLTRVKEDFKEMSDDVYAYDIMSLPELTPWELSRKLVLVVKKEDDNLDRLLDAFSNKYPTLQQKRLLIIDDEADLASVSFRKSKDGIVGLGTVSRQIDKLREMVADSDFLQVTATPYALYLQPENDVHVNGSLLFKPKRPKFTVILPTHDKYVGGDFYFEKSTDQDSPAYYFYRDVPLEEREALKKEDRRRLKLEGVLSEKRAAVLCEAILTFIVGGTIRRLQAKAAAEKPQMYSFLFHTEQARVSHTWQQKVAEAIRDALVAEAKEDSAIFNELLTRVSSDLRASVVLEGGLLPKQSEIKTEVLKALLDGQLMITKVNSEKDVEKQLDDDGQLKLRTPLNMFIGGQILDRGITINNLIGFYYGRNPKKFQQDTVLQHSRMYGARSMADLAVTRFYAPRHVYQVMKKIHELDSALRQAFESGEHERGVYFIQQTQDSKLIACSPNKLMFSKVVSIRPGRRLLPAGFQTVSKTVGAGSLSKLDKKIDALTSATGSGPILIEVDAALELLDLAYENLVFEDEADDERKAHMAALRHLSDHSLNKSAQGKVWLLAARDRNVKRYRESGRLSDAPDTKQQANAAKDGIPLLILMRQNGAQVDNWRDLPFWWPVIIPPQNAVTSIFAAEDSSQGS